MQENTPNHVTGILDRINAGDAHAADELLPIVYDHLRAVAGAVFKDSRRHTLEPTEIVHEAWIKLAGGLDQFDNRRHFFAVAAKAMRHVLADHAKAAHRLKRGGDSRNVTLHDALGATEGPEIDLVDLHDALEKLRTLNTRHAQVIELRLLSTMTIAEVGQTLGISQTTAHGDWNMACAWLRCELEGV